MNKRTFFGFLAIEAIIIILLVFASCRKKDHILQELGFSGGGPQSLATCPDGTVPSDIEKQLQWIARALPYVAYNNATFKSDMHQLLINDPLLKKHNAVSEPSLALSTPMHFSNTVYSAVRTLFTGNNYDSAYFFYFVYDDCLNRTLIRQNKEDADNYYSKMLVACAQYETSADSLTGYYWDTVNNHIDSLILHQDNADSFYLWIVEADNDCLDNDDPTAVEFPFNPEGHCGDGHCQPWLGEDPAHCSECIGENESGKYTLVLNEIEHMTDNNFGANINGVEDYCDRGYQETYFNGKYDIFFSYAIIADCTDSTPSYVKKAWYINSIIKRTFRDWYIDNEGSETKKWTDLILTRLNVGKGDVVRHFKHGNRDWTSSGGSGAIIAINKTLCFNFNPIKDRITIDMLEWDQGKGPYSDAKDMGQCGTDDAWWWPNYRQEYHQTGPATPDMTGSTGPDMNKRIPYFWGTLLSTTTNGADFWQQDTAKYGPGSKYVDLTYVGAQQNPSDPPFLSKPVGPNGVNQVHLTKPEMRIRFVLYLNP